MVLSHRFPEAQLEIKGTIFFAYIIGVVLVLSNDIMAGLAYLDQVARREQKPMVILLGLGSNQGSHTGSGPLSRMLDEIGALTEPGFARKLLPVYRRKDIKANPMRIKEWDYYLILADKHAVAFTLSDDGYIGLQSATLLDFSKPWEHTETILNAFPMGKFKLPSTSAKGNTVYHDKRLDMEFRVSEGERRLVCNFKNFCDGKDFSCDITLEQPPMDTMVIATPWKEKKTAFYYNQKINCLPATGSVILEGQDLLTCDRQERARKVAFLPQNRQVPEITVKNLVLHGRFPYLSYPRRYRQEDLRMAEAAMAQMGVAELENRSLGSLSGGQRPYEDFMWGGNPGAIRGIPADVNPTVAVTASTATLLPYAYLGDWSAFRWGYASDVKFEVIEYGDPDNTGSDLKGHNQVYMRCEAYIGWAILDGNAFAKIEA